MTIIPVRHCGTWHPQGMTLRLVLLRGGYGASALAALFADLGIKF